MNEKIKLVPSRVPSKESITVVLVNLSGYFLFFCFKDGAFVKKEGGRTVTACREMDTLPSVCRTSGKATHSGLRIWRTFCLCVKNFNQISAQVYPTSWGTRVESKILYQISLIWGDLRFNHDRLWQPWITSGKIGSRAIKRAVEWWEEGQRRRCA